MSEELSDAQIQSIMTALREGSRDQAIQVYQQATGCDPDAASDAIDQLAERFALADASDTPAEAPEEELPDGDAPRLTSEQAAQIANEIAIGRKVSAIKLYIDATGCDLMEAKKFVEALQERVGGVDDTQGSGGCVGLVLAVGALGTGLCYGAARLMQ